jgi:hypothetical protein
VVKLTPGKKDTQYRLAACGTARQRFVDDKGKPLPGLGSSLQLVLDAKKRFALVPATEGFSDKDGVLNATLIPGATYRYHDDKGKHEFEAPSGKEHKLPDIVVKLPRK